jgi:hypothetical protein
MIHEGCPREDRESTASLMCQVSPDLASGDMPTVPKGTYVPRWNDDMLPRKKKTT